VENEPYAEYLGEGYCDKARRLLTADDKICTDTMINSDVVIGGMKRILAPYLEGNELAYIPNDKVQIRDEGDYVMFQQAALYILAGILCSPIASRAKVPPFLGQKYQKNWKKKQTKLMQKGHLYLQSLMNREVKLS
jgi:hypothetical protein